MLDPIRRQLRSLIGTAADLDGILGDVDPDSLAPLDIAIAGADLAEACGRLEQVADRLANAAVPRLDSPGWHCGCDQMRPDSTASRCQDCPSVDAAGPQADRLAGRGQ